MKRPSLGAVLSPLSLVIVAAVLTLAYVGCHLAGWRDQVSIFSGTIAASTSLHAQVGKAAMYAGLYFATVLVVPILLLAAVIQQVVLSLLTRRFSGTAATPDER